MVSWIWIIVAVLVSSIVTFFFLAVGVSFDDKKNEINFKKLGYAEAVEDMRDQLIERMTHMEILLEQMQEKSHE